MNQILKEKAKEALTQNVEEILNRNNKNRFIEGFDAAEELIKELWPQEKQVTIKHLIYWTNLRPETSELSRYLHQNLLFCLLKRINDFKSEEIQFNKIIYNKEIFLLS